MKVLRYLLILAAIVLALVVATELLVRLLAPQPKEPGFAVRTKNDLPGMSGEDVVFRIDENGLRGYQWADKREPGSLRILVAGGQSTNHLLQNPENLWWGQMSGMLEKKTGRRVEAASVIVQPQPTILNGYVAVGRALEEVKVDLIIVMFGFGDVIYHPEDYTFNPDSFDTFLNTKPKYGLGYQLAQVSHVARWFRNRRLKDHRNREYGVFRRKDYYKNWLSSAIRRYRELPARATLSRDEDPLQEFLLGIEKLRALADTHGASLVVVGEPSLHHLFIAGEERARLHMPATESVTNGETRYVRLEPEWIEAEMNRYYYAAREKCAEMGIPFVFLNGDIPRYVSNFLTEAILTDEGARLAAEKILPSAAEAISAKSKEG